MLAPSLLLDLMCLQNFSLIFQNYVKFKNYDLVVTTFDKTVLGVD